ncbi:MAG: hypothetical protein GX556_03400 [Fibrobacter sp.]|nr:hypothetical protein [Fibrobacter sp.]
MRSDSPMMRRVRSNFLKYKIPKKGRIRFFLVIGLLIAGIWTGFKIFKNKTTTPEPKKTALSDAAPVKTAKKEKKKAVKKEKPARKKTTARKPSANHQKQGSKLVLPFTTGDLAELVKENHPDLAHSKDSVKFRDKNLLVHYSINTGLQELGISLMNKYHPLYGAVAAIDPVSGRVLVLVTYKNDSVPDLGPLYHRSLFPAASLFKTITAAAAIETGNLSSESMIQHAGRNHTLYRFQLERELKNFIEVPFEQAFAQSINPIFARIGMYSLQKGSLVNYGNRFGFNSPIPFDIQTEISQMNSPDSAFDIAELASGFNQQTTISPVHAAMIAGAICENGKMQKPTLIDSITMSDSCIYRARKETWRVPIKENTSSELRKMMKGVSRYGTARKSFRYIRQSERFANIEYGGKTGSVDKDGIGRVDWFMGFGRNPDDQSQRIAVAVLTVHGSNWTVHSSFIAAELIRIHLRTLQIEQEKLQKAIVEAKAG